MIKSYFAGGRSFLVAWISSICEFLWLPLLQGLAWSRRLLLRPADSDPPPPPPATAALLAASLKRFGDSKYGQSHSSMLQTATPFSHQVAGHTAEVLVGYKDIILKPKLKESCFYNELSFYETVFSPTAYGASLPQRFVPVYHGAVMLPTASGEEHPFIAMDDQTKGFSRPSIIDIKMGQQTYEPGAPLSKIERTRVKYPFQEEIGFRITGLKVFDGRSRTYYATDKSYGRALGPDNVAMGLLPFFYDGYSFRRDVINIVIEKLELLLRWFKSQNRYLFFCSSLLIIYEGNDNSAPTIRHEMERAADHFLQRARQRALDEVERTAPPVGSPMGAPGHLASPPGRSRWLSEGPLPAGRLAAEEAPSGGRAGCKSYDDVQIRMIDFAHTLRSEHGVPDAGYIYGLSSLLRSLRGALAIIDASSGESILTGAGSILIEASANAKKRKTTCSSAGTSSM